MVKIEYNAKPLNTMPSRCAAVSAFSASLSGSPPDAASIATACLDRESSCGVIRLMEVSSTRRKGLPSL